MKKTFVLKLVGIIGIFSIACCGIAWIGLLISPPWEQAAATNEIEM